MLFLCQLFIILQMREFNNKKNNHIKSLSHVQEYGIHFNALRIAFYMQITQRNGYIYLYIYKQQQKRNNKHPQ